MRTHRIFRFILPREVPVRKKKRRRTTSSHTRRQAYLRHKENARRLVHAKLAALNVYYGFTWSRIAIRDQKSRWGSCSKKGNLNFNYRLVHLPEDLVDYIIVHELCHRGVFSHGKEFWDLVARTVPDHKEKRRRLRTLEKEMFKRKGARTTLVSMEP